MTEDVNVLEAEIVSEDRREVEVTVLEAGLSKMGWYYSPDLLRRSIALFDGARAFADHPAPNDRPERSIRDVVGYYHSPRFVPGNRQGTETRGRGSGARGQEGEIGNRGLPADSGPGTADSGLRSPDSGFLAGDSGPGTRDPGLTGRPAHIRATLRVLENAGWLWSLIREAIAEGRPDLIGLSVDFLGRVRNAQVDGRDVRLVESIQRLFSVDVVTRPSAGGRFERILMGEQPGWELGVEADPAGTGSGTPLPEGNNEGAKHMANPETTADAGGKMAATEVAEADSGRRAPDPELERARLEARQLVAELQQQRRQMEAERTLERELEEAGLPAPVTEKLRRRFAAGMADGNPPAGARIREAIDEEREALGQLANLGLIQGMGFEKEAAAGVSVGRTSLQKLQVAMDQLFDLEVAESERVPKLSGIREAYILATGDSGLQSFGPSAALEEALVREGEVVTTTFSFLLGTSMNKRLLKDYQAWPAEWRHFCTEVPIKDFKQQDRIRLGAFGSLSQVAEDTPYTELALTDTRAIYHANKYGNIVAVSREVIVNDDLHAIRQIPAKLAVAAAYTLAEFVYDFLSTGRTAFIYDGQTLFDAAAGPYNHGHNRRVDALSSQAMQTGVTTVKEQANMAGKRIGLKPSFLVVPPELEFQAMTIVRSGGLPGGNYNDINPMLGYAEVIVSPQLTNAVEWYLVANPRMVDTIEIGFVGGQVNPVLLVQDSPLMGLNFTQDVISYKIRHEYGGAVVDYRGFYSGGD
ncbi:MAG: Mu-like prophage major head subunit gpT family protein [Chloroflexota bacterium]|nr:Mu-like prophage major head subunit gpT family protein [Chloroflexota bacterium]